MINNPTPLISIIMPVYNGASFIEQALRGIRNSSFQDYELIIIDDCSTDSTSDIIKKYKPHIHIRNDKNQGPFVSRNIGVEHARGKIIVFTDADIEFKKDTLQKICYSMVNGDTLCLIGLYTLATLHKNIATVYKNSWIRYSYLTSPDNASWFFTAIGAVDRDVWDRHEGFHSSFNNDQGGDLAFGKRLVNNGISIKLDKTLEVKHLKKFSLVSLLRNDFRRAYAYTHLLGYVRNSVTTVARKGFSNIYPRFLIATLLSGLMLLCFVLGCVSYVSLIPAGILFFMFLFVKRGFLRYLATNISVIFSLACIPVMLLDHLACGFGVAWGLATYPFIKRK